MAQAGMGSPILAGVLAAVSTDDKASIPSQPRSCEGGVPGRRVLALVGRHALSLKAIGRHPGGRGESTGRRYRRSVAGNVWAGLIGAWGAAC